MLFPSFIVSPLRDRLDFVFKSLSSLPSRLLFVFSPSLPHLLLSFTSAFPYLLALLPLLSRLFYFVVVLISPRFNSYLLLPFLLITHFLVIPPNIVYLLILPPSPHPTPYAFILQSLLLLLPYFCSFHIRLLPFPKPTHRHTKPKTPNIDIASNSRPRRLAQWRNNCNMKASLLSPTNL